MAPTICPAISRTKSNAWESKLRPPACENQRATASQSASSAPHMGRFRSRGSYQGDIRRSPASVWYPRSEPDCMTRPVSEHDQPHIRSPRTAAAPTSRLRRFGAQEDETILEDGFLGHAKV